MKRTIKPILMMALLVSFTAVSCRKGCTDPSAINYDPDAKKSDDSCQFDTGDPYLKSGSITENETWTSNNIYTLSGKVVIKSGVTVTIEPGTIIKAEEGTGTLASALIVAQGGKLNAVGTATQPIIFTSILDNIQTGQLVGTNLDEFDQGLWGGVIVLGNAPISAANGDVTSQIEGIPTSDAFGAYGGSDPADNSGSLSYISIRHGGTALSPGKEINGLTLGGVGSGTTISNIEVVANFDDGIEFFGGTVNASNLIVGFQGDDGIDIDMNYSGTVDNFVVINGNNSDESLEVDGPEGSTYTSGQFTLQNGLTTAYGGGSYPRGEFKSKAQGFVNNVITDTLRIRASYENDCLTPKTDAFTHLTDASPKLVFTTAEFDGLTVFTYSDNGIPDPANNNEPTPCGVTSGDQNAAQSVLNSTTATGATTTGFTSWTWCGITGKL